MSDDAVVVRDKVSEKHHRLQLSTLQIVSAS